jgi:diguanylate cyclase (GGDEF)-like protein/PAS domain S-box-containing protein
MLWSVSADGETNYYRNRQWLAFTGWAGETLSFGEWQDLIHPEDRSRVAEAWSRSVLSGDEYKMDYRLRHHSGLYRWVSSKGSPQRNEKGDVIQWHGTCSDIHDRVVAEEQAEESAKLTQGVVEASPDCVSLLALDGTVLLVNRSTLDCYGVTEAELLGRPWGSRLPNEYAPTVQALLAKAQAGEVGRSTVHVPHKGGVRWWDMVVSPVRDREDRIIRVAVSSRDVSDQRRAAELTKWAATHDPLTRISNRSLFNERLEWSIANARQSGDTFAVAILDVDHFKNVNDTLGHDAGDALLTAFAERLTASIRQCDLVARLGGDEFAMLLSDVGTTDTLEAALNKVLEATRQPFVFKGRIMDCSATLGVSIYRGDALNKAALLKNADVALYAAKTAGRGRWLLFAPEMRSDMQRRSSMISLAKQALAREWISPYYQPKVRLADGKLAGFEALLRWRHPRKGLQLPGTIKASFEDPVLSVQITDAMLHRVYQDMRSWEDAGRDFGHVAVNASAADFGRGDFADRILQSLTKARLRPSSLQVEVTETVFLGRGAECVESALKTLSAEGVKIALDDFGTGYASLSHLKQFPVDILKIDRSFISGLTDDADDAAIVGAVVNLGRSLDIAIVAEGVETLAQHHQLAALACDYGQGFLYGKAKSAQAVGQFMEPSWHAAAL